MAAVVKTQPPFKRRKLVGGSESANNGTGTPPPKVHSPNNVAKALPLTISCTFCHRALNITQQSFNIVCARCSLPTCAVCSRTCTACAPSQPPTPHLTWSPSPSPLPSPRRSVLALNSANTNLAPTNALFNYGVNLASKRKKVVDDELPIDEGGKDGDPDTEPFFGPGCGKTVCRNCCYENIQSNSITCYDCYGR